MRGGGQTETERDRDRDIQRDRDRQTDRDRQRDTEKVPSRFQRFWLRQRLLKQKQKTNKKRVIYFEFSVTKVLPFEHQ